MNSVIAFLTILIFAVSMMIRIVDENSRIAQYKLGRYIGLFGPGLILVPLHFCKAVTITVNDRGILNTDGTCRLGTFDYPAIPEGRISAGDYIKVTGFEDQSIRVALDSDQSRTVICEKCGHENRIT